MVRGKVELKRIEIEKNRQVTFSKRKAGLLKKAYELSLLCDVEVGVIVYSRTGRMYEFASSSMEQIISRYNRTIGTSSSSSQSRAELELEQQAELIEALRLEVSTLKTEYLRLQQKDLKRSQEFLRFERQVNNSHPTCRCALKNSNVEPELSLRPPSFPDQKLKGVALPNSESASMYCWSRMEK